MNPVEAISRVVAEAFVAGLWQGVVLVGVVALILRALPRMGAGARFGIWGLAFLAAAGVPILGLTGHASGASGGGLRVGSGWGFAVAGCWGLLMVWRVGRLVADGLRLRRIWQDAVAFDGGEGIAGLLAEMPRRPVLCVSGEVDAPSVIGFWSPKLLLPAWQAGRLSEKEMRQIVLHECEHLRRGDDWMNLAQKVGLALFPLNPALLWADRRMGLEREMACDAGVVGRTRQPFDYAACLTRLAEQRLGRRSLGLALSAWGRESELGQRVHRLLRPLGSMGKAQRRVSVGILAMVMAGGSLELARMPRLLAFGKSVQVAASSPEVVEHVPGAAAGRMMPVVYREPVRTERAITKVRVSSGKTARRVLARRNDAGWRKRATLERRGVIAGATAGMMLTSAETGTILPTEPVRVRMVKAVEVRSYAAVPFGNGWLILQL